MSQQPMLEVVLFHVKAGVTDTQVLAASAKTQEWLAQADGYLARELSKDDEGQWLDIVHWRTLAAAQAAAEQIMQQPCAADFMAIIDPERITMLHVKQQQHFMLA